MYTANYKCCWKKAKKIEINGERCHSVGLEDSVLLKWQFSPYWSLDSVQSISISKQNFFVEVEKLMLKFIWKCQNNFEKGRTKLDKLFQMKWGQWWKEYGICVRPDIEANRTQIEFRSKISYSQSVDFQQRCQGNSMGKDRGFFKTWCYSNWMSICKEMNLDPYFTP